jgi:hypothetical protein
MLEVVALITYRGNYINNASDATRAMDYNIDKFIYCPKMYRLYKDQDMFVEVHVLSYEVLFSFVFPVSMKAHLMVCVFFNTGVYNCRLGNYVKMVQR